MKDTRGLRIYHNPRCSKSRATLALLEERGLAPEVIDYLRTPPSAEELRSLIAMLDGDVRALLRDDAKAGPGTAVTDRGTDDVDTIVAAITADPQRLQRPIVVAGDHALIARPPERVFELIER